MQSCSSDVPRLTEEGGECNASGNEFRSVKWIERMHWFIRDIRPRGIGDGILTGKKEVSMQHVL